MPGKQVRLKSFDVDDPTPLIDVEVKIDQIVDTNDLPVARGNDNQGTPQAGTLAQILLTLDGTGSAETQLTLPMQPGDNLRVAAVFETNNAQAHLDSLQVTNATAAFYVTSDTNQIKDFLGGVSPMLTVWRKLHLEFESMEAPPASGAQINFWPVTIFRREVQTNGVKLLVRGASSNQDYSFNRFEGGRVSIPGVGDYKIVSSANDFASVNVAYHFLLLTNNLGTNVVGLNATIYDDDDNYLTNSVLFPSLVGLPSPPLPAEGRAAEIVTNIATRFSDAYILPVNANALGWNTMPPRIPFKRNADAYDQSVFNNGNLQLIGKDRPGFWAYSVVFAYQDVVVEDGDPNKEGFVGGVLPKSSFAHEAPGWLAIYVEGVRETALITHIGSPQNFSSPIASLEIKNDYNRWLSGTVAHELGHAPGKQYPDPFLLFKSDHGEKGLMQDGGTQITGLKFTAPTIRRFRQTDKWTGE